MISFLFTLFLTSTISTLVNAQITAPTVKAEATKSAPKQDSPPTPPKSDPNKPVAKGDIFGVVNKTYNVESMFRSKIIGVGMKRKAIDLSKPDDMKAASKNLDKLIPNIKKQWMTELEKKFTKKELDYISTVLGHELFVRLKDFQNDFQISAANEELISKELKSK